MANLSGIETNAGRENSVVKTTTFRGIHPCLGRRQLNFMLAKVTAKDGDTSEMSCWFGIKDDDVVQVGGHNGDL